jgi:transcriptional regulator with XRE-family HTH domain
MKTIYAVVGESVRSKRLQLGLTLEDLSELSALHASYIGQIERNTKKASLRTVAVLAKALNIPVKELFAAAAVKDDDDHSKRIDAILRSNSRVKRKLILDVLRQLSKGLKELR